MMSLDLNGIYFIVSAFSAFSMKIRGIFLLKKNKNKNNRVAMFDRPFNFYSSNMNI